MFQDTLEPAQAIYVLNCFYTLFVDCIHLHNGKHFYSILLFLIFLGIVDKFTGSSGQAFFGQPFPTQHDIEHAIYAALDLKFAAQDLNYRLEAEGFSHIKFGIGLSTETSLCGIVGAGAHFEYTVVGSNNF